MLEDKKPHAEASDNRSVAFRRAPFVIVLSLWLVAVAMGSLFGIRYETTSSRTAVAPVMWPEKCPLSLSLDRPTLIMFVHPKCPCSRASLHELAVLISHCQGRVATHVIFLLPKGFSEDWARTDLWESASAIPDVSVCEDIGGIERRRFGAQVSGETFLFRPNGQLLFHGGITGARGHSGDNLGRYMIQAYLLDPIKIRSFQGGSTSNTPVFGCEL